MNWLVPLILLALSIVSIVLSVSYARKYEYKNIHNKSDCDKQSQNCTGKDCCAIWSGGVCRKGTVDGLECKSRGHIGPLIVMVTGILMFIGFLVTLIMTIASRHKEPVQMGFLY